MLTENNLRPNTVKLLKKFITPLSDIGAISIHEEKLILSNLKHLAAHGELLPPMPVKLLTTEETAEILSLGVSNLKKLLKNNKLPLRKKYLGSSVRFRSRDVYLLAMDDNDYQ